MNEIILDVCLDNGLHVCIWRDIDNAVWEVEVFDEKYNKRVYIEVFKDARVVLEYLRILTTW